MTLYTAFFLLGFLPISVAVYYAVPLRARYIALCAINFAFYALGAGKFCFALPILTLATYGLSYLPPRIGFFCILSVLPLLRFSGISAVGVSFFILRAAAYLYDGHREKNILRLSAFLMFFPTVAAGPLTRWEQVRRSFERTVDYRLIERGIFLSLAGLLKKLFFADALYDAFGQFYAGGTALSAVSALVCYALYIYFDFSGYSDIAIGISAVFGFDLPKNFDHPYLARSVGEFFRRWHISLGTWLRDYVYIPLGGSRSGKGRMLLSLAAVWLASALWHGTALSYLLWGGWFFCLLAAEKLLLPKGIRLGYVTTLASVLVGWVFFFAKTSAAAIAFFGRLFCLGDTLLYCRADLYHCVRLAPFVCLAAFCATPILWEALAALYRRKKLLLYPLAVAAFVLVLSCLVAFAHQPFLYASF